MSFKSGQTIDEYQILAEIGSGGNGIVFKGKSIENGSIVAIKTPWKERIKKDPRMVSSFLRETSAIERLEHPHIAKYYKGGTYHFEEEGQQLSLPYITMELVEGTPFTNMKNAPIRQIVSIMQKVSNAVAYAHGKGVIHRDLKPTNIIINKDGSPKILDFGLARLMDEISTSSAIFEGSPSYAAPEQFKGQSCDERTDIWSLGAILFELLTGRPPFLPQNADLDELSDIQKVFSIQERVLNDPVPKPSQYNPEIDNFLDEICIKSMSKDPKQRYQNTEDIATALERWGRINRDIWIDKAQKTMKITKFLPFLRKGRIKRAYQYIEKGLSYGSATSSIKEKILDLLGAQGMKNLSIVEMQLPENIDIETWDNFKNTIDKISKLQHKALIPVKKTIIGISKSNHIPHQILAVYENPAGKNLRGKIGQIETETALELVYKITELTSYLQELGISTAIPSPHEIFIDPIQIVAIGWPFRADKGVNAKNLASLLYYALTGFNPEIDTSRWDMVPEKFRDSIMEAFLEESEIKTAQDFIHALERNKEARKILQTGILDRPFQFPAGEYTLDKSLQIENTGHLKLQHGTIFKIQSHVRIECSGQITAKGKWDETVSEGSIIFSPAKAKDGWGGIVLQGDDTTISEFEGCTFEGGHGSIEKSGTISGGAIRLEEGILKIKKSRFKNNNVGDEGGAIYAKGENPIELELSKVVFTENSSNCQGGAISINASGKAIFNKCKFQNNRSGEDGGVLHIKGLSATKTMGVFVKECISIENRSQTSGGVLSISNYVKFKSNSCQYESNVAEESGGVAVLIGKDDETSKGYFIDSTFTGNRCQIRGGAIATKKHSYVDCDSCDFDGNSSDRDSGGAVGIDGKGGLVKTKARFHNTTFSENRCRIDGGAINSNINTESTFTNCKFEGNFSEDNSGGAFVIVGENPDNYSLSRFADCSFSRNRCKMAGGAINVNIYTKTFFEDCRFKNNNSEDCGGAFEIVGEEGENASETNFKNIIFSGNRCKVNGGAVHCVDTTVISIEQCQFENNRADEDAGAFHMKGFDNERPSKVIFSDSTFHDNRSKQSAGAINISFHARAKFENCELKGNYAEAKCGGAIQVIGKDQESFSEATFKKVKFLENSSKLDGGALHIGDYSLAIFDKSSFEKNRAENSGGAISLVGREGDYPTKLTFRQVIFKNNVCTLDGGAIAAGYHTRIIMSDSKLHGNRANASCGAIGIVGKSDEEGSKAKFTKVIFSHNYAKTDGGAIATGNHAQVIFEDCRFEGNYSDGACGAIGISGKDKKNLSDATFTKVSFIQNYCTIDGGAMVIGRYSRTKFQTCVFEENYVKKKTGGAILILGKDSNFATIADFNNVIFRKNYCAIDGGAINVNIYTQVTFVECLFEENYAEKKNGGAIVLLGKDGVCPTKARFEKVTFRKNYCKISGGAINANDYTRSHFHSCLFEENRAISKNGGAVLVLGEDGKYPSDAKFVQVQFKKNYCVGSGGAVNANVYTISHFEDCLFEQNWAEDNGGGIFIRGLRRLPNKATVEGCYFIGNVAGKIGADVALKGVKGVTEQTLLNENTIEIPEPDFQAEEAEEEKKITQKKNMKKAIKTNETMVMDLSDAMYSKLISDANKQGLNLGDKQQEDT